MTDRDSPANIGGALGGRLPLLDPGTLNEAQRSLYERLLQGAVPWAEHNGFLAMTAGGRLIGPFNGFLYSPQLSDGYNAWISAEQHASVLSGQVRQVVILTVGVAWQAEYEIYAHVAVGRAAELPEPVIATILASRDPTGDFTADEAAAYDYTRTLVNTKRLDDVTFERAVDRFGHRGVVDMTHLIGQYLATSALLNAFDVPAPPAAEQAGPTATEGPRASPVR